MTITTVSKLDAVRAQIDAAIELYFRSDNPIAVHTLTAAAYNVLRDMALKNGDENPFIKISFVNEYPKAKQKVIRAFLNEPENFFKHADRDPNNLLSFDPEITELLLMDACAYFRDKKELRPRYYDIYKVWNGVCNDDLSPEMKMFTEAARDAFKSKGKMEFWDFMKTHLTNRLT